MVKIRFILAVLFFMSGSYSYAQVEEIKAARKAVDTLFISDKEKALEITMEYLPKSKIINDTFHITYFLDQAGEINRFLGNLREAESQLKECLGYKVNWENLKDLSITYNNLGKTYKHLGEYELSFYNFLEAYKLMEKANNLFGQGYYLNNIGALFDDQHNYEKAIEYYNKSFDIKKITNDSSGMASTSYNVGILYYNMAEYDLALDYFKKSFKSVSYQRSVTKKLRALVNIAQTYLDMDKLNKAKNAMLEADKQIKAVESNREKLDYYSVLGRIYLAEGQLDSAIFYNQKSLTISRQIEIPVKIQRALILRSEIMEKSGKPDSALFYLKLGQLYFDSLVNVANLNAIASMEGKYKFERNLRILKEAELETARTNEALKENQLKLLYVVFALILAVGIIIFTVCRTQATRRNADLLKGQNVLIANQNLQLNHINERISEELGTLKLSIQEKEEILNNVFTKSNADQLPPEIISLSKREKEVLANLALGLSDEQLGEKLFVSKSTVKTHLRRLYSKLLVNNRAQAVAIAHKYGIIGVT